MRSKDANGMTNTVNPDQEQSDLDLNYLSRSFCPRSFCPPGSTVGFLLLRRSSGVVRYPRDLQVSVATGFMSSPHVCFIIVFICDLFVSCDYPLMS